MTLTLSTAIQEGRFAFVGVGGGIDGAINPPIHLRAGDVARVVLVNGDGAQHDFVAPDFHAHSEHIHGSGTETTVVLKAGKTGEFPYYCSVPGHREAGMEGKIVVG